MVNNIAANVLGGAPESTAGAGNSSAAGLNMTELLFPAETIQSAASSGLKTVIRITETTSITEEMTVSLSDTAGDPRVQTRPDVERIVTLLPEEEPDQSSEGLLEPGADRQERSESACSCSHRDSLQEYLLQRCSSPDLLQKTPSTASVTQEPQSPSLSPDIEDLAPSLTSDVLLLVSADSSRAATRPIELMCASASECLSETLPQQSADHLTESSQKPDLTSTSAARSEEDQISLDHHIPAPTVS
ncbi:uncharacterized protein LOC122332451 [Puntigrus tetrazona]|uniref:uncharacterized protein LOC122332451 n=1 Tax=Puntigrus tetrazona TaxID=1606681 RepID=UPI001C8AFD3B|nr:uncharacterized protein LOC122332451 [Puntigrus tetrazona]